MAALMAALSVDELDYVKVDSLGLMWVDYLVVWMAVE
jgi:hypothetical protein